MKLPERIVLDPDTMGGKPCIRGTRVTVGLVVGMLSKGHELQEILKLYPYLKSEDQETAATFVRHGAVARSTAPVLIDSGPNKGVRAMFLRDPDGISIELYEPSRN